MPPNRNSQISGLSTFCKRRIESADANLLATKANTNISTIPTVKRVKTNANGAKDSKAAFTAIPDPAQISIATTTAM